MKLILPDYTNASYRLLKLEHGYELTISIFAEHNFFASGEISSEEERNPYTFEPWVYFDQNKLDILFDEGFAKPRGEFLLYGHAYSRNEFGCENIDVSVTVGDITKKLFVSGDRIINSLGLLSHAAKFDSMAIIPSNTYGGVGFQPNKLGKGAEFLTDPSGEKFWPVPNVTYPHQVMLSRNEILDPAGFWALSCDVPHRRNYLGKFDDHWVKTNWPEIPYDTDPLYYQTAPTDQQFESYFKGNEHISIKNMHPEHTLIETMLPGVRVRLFVEHLLDSGPVFKELVANADTLWLFPDQLKAYIAFRSKLNVVDRDASDVVAVFCVLEQIDQPPASFEDCYARYSAEVRFFEDFETEDTSDDAEYTVDSKFFSKESAIGERSGMPDSAIQKLEQFEQDMDVWSQAEMKSNSIKPKDLENFMNKTEPQVQGSLLDLKKVIKKANQDTLDVFQKVGVSEEELLATLMESPESLQLVEEIKQAGGLTGIFEQFEKSIDSLVDLEKNISNPDPNDPEVLALVNQMQKDQQAREELDEPTIEEPRETKPNYDREWVVAHHAAGKSFRGYELERLDLSELNLSGADFSGAVLTKTDLTAALLNGVRFDDALLSEVIFNRANLSESSFRRVSASGSEFNEAHLQKANLRDGDFTGAMFSGADLSQAILSGAICTGANFSGVRAERLMADKAELADVNLTKANLVDARLTHIGLVGASMKGSDLSRANCLRADFSGADASDCNFSESLLQDSQADVKTTFSRSNFQKAILNEVSWDAPTLNQANFNEAQMDGADLTGARMLNVSMINVIARGAVFDKVDLERSDLTGSDMFEASFCDANLNSTRLQNGNYFAADFKGIKYEGASFEGSNIDRTILKIRQQ
jgi:uncharacterized protein YjbI with pentapeptide repeats